VSSSLRTYDGCLTSVAEFSLPTSVTLALVTADTLAVNTAPSATDRCQQQQQHNTTKQNQSINQSINQSNQSTNQSLFVSGNQYRQIRF